MISDYYDGSRRERLMLPRTTVAATSVFVFNNLGGAIAELLARAIWGVRRRPLVGGVVRGTLFFGRFANPILFAGLEKAIASPRSQAIGIEGSVVVGMAVVALVTGAAQRARR